MWLQFVWMDFLKHFNWNEDKGGGKGIASDSVDSDPVTGGNINANAGPWHGQFVDEPAPPGSHNGFMHDQALNGHILVKSLHFGNATPLIFTTISNWSYFQWTSFVLFIFIVVYMIALYLIGMSFYIIYGIRYNYCCVCTLIHSKKS